MLSIQFHDRQICRHDSYNKVGIEVLAGNICFSCKPKDMFSLLLHDIHLVVPINDSSGKVGSYEFEYVAKAQQGRMLFN